MRHDHRAATHDLTAVRARLEAAGARRNRRGAGRRGRTQVEELELWLDRIKALLSEELAAPGLPAADDPFDGLLGTQDSGRRGSTTGKRRMQADIDRPAAERGRPSGLGSATQRFAAS